MIQIENLDTINNRLKDHYGVTEDKPNFRVVWSEDQLEKRRGTFRDFTNDGFFIREVTEVREVPKYRQYIHEKYLLERLTVVPEMNKVELLELISYEPLWVFETKKGDPLRPTWLAANYVIEQTLHNIEHAGQYTKYKQSDNTPEEKEKRILALEETLYGNESDISDALAHNQAIVVPHNYTTQKDN